MGPIQSSGMPVGMVPPSIFDQIIEDTSIHFGTNDALLLYTDGVTECTNLQGEEYGSARLSELLRAYGDKDAQCIIEHTLESVQRFSQGNEHQLDDLTLIAVKHA